MLDPWFKSLQIVKKLVGHGDAIRLAFKYDLKIIIPLFMTCFVTLDPNIETWTQVGHGDELEDEGNMMFEVGTSYQESSQVFVIGKLYVLKRLSITLVACEDTLIW